MQLRCGKEQVIRIKIAKKAWYLERIERYNIDTIHGEVIM